MRVLHIVPGVPFGGMQRVVLDLAVEQRKQGLDANVLILYDSDPMRLDLQANGVPVYTVNGLRPSLRSMVRYRSLIRNSGAELVHLHGGLLWSNALGLADKRCPWLFHAHSYPSADRGLRNLALKLTNSRLVDAIVGVSRSVSEAYAAHARPGVPVFTVYNGVALRQAPEAASAPRRSGAPTFGMATRLASDKGVLEFIEVAAHIARRLPDARFVMAGDGPLLGEALARAAERGLSNRVTFPGFISDIDQYWHSLDVAVFTSPREPFGLRLIEPMLLGIPVVAYRTGAGSDEILQDGENALVAEWGNTEALAEKAVSLENDADARSRLTRRAQEIAKELYSIAEMARGITRVYERFQFQNASLN